ncbi:MAG: serine/threonine protein kinase [Deltaproteobacteria bacterium]|nr:serine/threonine protein kinase [Deltaproteobacteria bacterium]
MSAEAQTPAAKKTGLEGAVLGGKYRLQHVLGSGGVGVVYAAANTWTGRQVALKVLRQEFAENKDVVRRFLREAQAPTRISHPNVVDVLDLGEDRVTGQLYIVQELLVGTDLRAWIDARSPMSPRESLDLIVPILGALVAAHRRGVLHRDIKPENIFLVRAPDGKVLPKIIDFGVSKVIDRQRAEDERRTTMAGMVFGTPHYMSPEQARGDHVLDPRSDLWSVGAVLFEMLTGKAPFEAPTYNLLMVKVITEPAPKANAVQPSVPQDVADIVSRALTHDLDGRFPSARAFLSAILESTTFQDGRAENGAVVLPDEAWEGIAPVARDIPTIVPFTRRRSALLQRVTPQVLTGITVCAAITSLVLALTVGARPSRPMPIPASIPQVAQPRETCPPPAPPPPALAQLRPAAVATAPPAAEPYAARRPRARRSAAPIGPSAAPRLSSGSSSRGGLRPASAYPE